MEAFNLNLDKASQILVGENEAPIREMVTLALQEEGFKVVSADNGQAVLTLLESAKANQRKFTFDLIIFDWLLPEVSGLEICQFLRSQGNDVPIIILSAKGSESDRIAGLEMGADAYFVKPFSIRELVARSRSLLRRYLNDWLPTAVLRFKDISLIPEECRVIVRQEEIKLSYQEFRLLQLLLKNPGQVWSREELLNQIWGDNFEGGMKTIDVHIGWLRKKLELDPKQPEYITTVRGFGYRFG